MTPMGAGDEILRVQSQADPHRDGLLPLVGVRMAGEGTLPKLHGHFVLEDADGDHPLVSLEQ